MWIDPLGLNPFNRITGQTVQRATDLSTLRPGMQGWKDALTAIGNGAVLSLGGDTSVRLKHRQGRWQRQVLVLETVKVQKSLITDIELR